MRATEADEFFMAQALELAEKGRGFVAPNPLVGAVVVKNGKIVGKGYHEKFGRAHAEINALNEAKENARGATLYVTLEPCTFYGKTPACVDSLITAGLRRVVIATKDPNPKVFGKGVALLKKAGIETEVGIKEEIAQRQNESYFKFVKAQLPFVVLKLAQSLDGKIALLNGKSKWIDSPRSRNYSQKLRLYADAILVGINTILKDDPRLTCRIVPDKELLKVVLDTNLQIPLNARVLNKGNTLIFTAVEDSRKRNQLIRKGAKIITIKADQGRFLPWPRILSELYQIGIQTLLIEGGAKIAASALRAKIVDKVYLFLAPIFLGEGLSYTQGIELKSLKDAIKLKEYKLQQIGKDILIEGYL
ncbi:MAG: bifunctional diaminohydroxyphosphoribosylaminopyrimidine deaminase/5-amino-6-(5-phosphoribosylamino)uracil reductase RibD [candidate division WOR-3 bacterium]